MASFFFFFLVPGFKPGFIHVDFYQTQVVLGTQAQCRNLKL